MILFTDYHLQSLTQLSVTPSTIAVWHALEQRLPCLSAHTQSILEPASIALMQLSHADLTQMVSLRDLHYVVLMLLSRQYTELYMYII